MSTSNVTRPSSRSASKKSESLATPTHFRWDGIGASVKLQRANHPSEEVLELFAMNRREDIGDHHESNYEEVEEHILFCGGCLERLKSIDAFLSTLKAALTVQGGQRKMTA